MSGIIHDQGTCCLLVLDNLFHFRVGIAGRRRLSGIGIPHHALHVKSGRSSLGNLGCIVGILHVNAVFPTGSCVVPVVSHEHEDILPSAHVLVLHISYRLVNHSLGFHNIAHRKAPYSNVVFVTHAATTVNTLSIVKQSEKSVVGIRVCLAERVFALIGEQEIVWRIAFQGRSVHAVIPQGVTKEQQILGHVCFSLCPVIEHLEIATVGIDVWRTA